MCLFFLRNNEDKSSACAYQTKSVVKRVDERAFPHLSLLPAERLDEHNEV